MTPQDKRPYRRLTASALDWPLGWELQSRLRRAIGILVDSTIGPHLLFSLATVTAIGLIGYHFGTFDQIITLAVTAQAYSRGMSGWPAKTLVSPSRTE